MSHHRYTLLAKAQGHRLVNEYHQASTILKKLLSQPHGDIQATLDYASMLQDLGQRTLAKRVVSLAVAENPNDSVLQTALAEIYIRLREIGEAERLLRRVLAYDNAYAPAILGWARLLAAKGYWDEARQEFERAMVLNPVLGPAVVEGLDLCDRQRAWRKITDDSVTDDTELAFAKFEDGTLSETVVQVGNLLSEKECLAIKAIATRRKPQAGTIVSDQKDPETRRSLVYWLSAADLPPNVCCRLIAALDRMRCLRKTSEIDEIELFQVSCYLEDDKGCYNWHSDAAEKYPEGATRKLTMSVQLSPPEDYRGAALEVADEHGVLKAPSSIGAALIFPSSREHRVTQAVQGSRWSMTCWGRGPIAGKSSGLRQFLPSQNHQLWNDALGFVWAK